MKTILVVDDEERIRSFYKKLLTLEGYRVLIAENAIKANEDVKTKNVDLVLLDLRMPMVEGDDFFEVLQLFHRDTPVIISSVFPIEKQRELVTGASAYYDKSLGVNNLLSKIRMVLWDDAGAALSV